MTPQTPTEIVEAFIAAVEAKDLDVALTYVTDDIEYDNVPMGKVFGPDGVRSILGPMVEHATEVKWTTHRSAAEGDLVFTERTDHFALPAGPLDIAVAGLFEIRDGRIALWRDYFDMAEVAKAMGG